jgi:hypothetical protein
MKKKEILEFNKKCAEFLGGENHPILIPYVSEWDDMWFDSIKYPNFQNSDGSSMWKLQDLKFHSDWNWIIEIIEAIENIGYATRIDHNYSISNYGCDRCEIDTVDNALTEYNEKEKPIVFELTDSKKETVVKTINKFLDWYNTYENIKRNN